MPVGIDLTIDVDLLSDQTPAKKADQLFYLTRESLARHQIDERRRAKRATAPKSLVGIILSEPVLEAVRRELWRQTKHKVDAAELASLLKDTVLRPDPLA